MEEYNIYKDSDIWKNNFLEQNGQFKPNLEFITSEIGKKKRFAEFQKDTSYSLVIFAYATAKQLAEKLKPTQLRRFYTYVKKLQYKVGPQEINLPPEVLAGLAFLPPKLAGASIRKGEVKPLFKVISACLANGKITTKPDYDYFVEFFEAILDYHQVLSKEKSNQKESNS